MNMIGRLLRLTPILVGSAYTCRRVWMSEVQKQENKPIIEEKEQERIKLVIPIIGEVPLGQQQTQPKGEKNQKDDVRSEQVINERSEIINKAQHINEEKLLIIDQNVQAKIIQNQKLTQNTQNEPIEIKVFKPEQHIQNNQVVISKTCPIYIVNYFKALNLKILESSTLQTDFHLKNNKGQILSFEACKISTTKDQLKLISNFMNPPLQIQSIKQLQQLMKLQQKDSFLIASYIPFPAAYDELIKQRTASFFDNFTTSRKVDIAEIERKYIELANNSSTNKTTYIILRNKQIADYLKINSFKIGQPFIYNHTTRESGNMSNCQWMGAKYYMTGANKLWKFGQGDNQCVNKLAHFYINKIESEVEMYNKIRQIQMSGDTRKVLLFFTNQERQEFQKQTDEILENVGRVQKDKVIVIKTKNQMLLRRVFKVEPDNFATVRLFNLSQEQKPLFQGHQQREIKYFSRSKYQGAFKFENVCEFVNSLKWKQHYENKRKLTYVKPLKSNQLKNLDNTLVLLQKQGCQGCKYMQQTLDQLKKVTKSLKFKDKYSKNMIYRYKIQDPSLLVPLKIRRYSIYNEDQQFTPPTTTPRLYLFYNGKYVDLKAEQSIGKLNSVKNQVQATTIHDTILSDIINRIRTSQDQIYNEL